MQHNLNLSRPSLSGVVLSMEESALNTHIDNVKSVVRRAYGTFPLDDGHSAFERWMIIRKGIDKARECMDFLLDMGPDDWAELTSEINFASEMNLDCNRQALEQSIGRYMGIFREAMIRGRAA